MAHGEQTRPSLIARMREAVESDALAPLKLIAYRYTRRRYSTARLLMNGVGAWKAGGRWNAPGAFHAVYLASSHELAHREYFEAYRVSGLGAFQGMPFVGNAIELDLRATVDLRAESMLAALGVSTEAILNDPWRQSTDGGTESLCQAIGRAAFECGIQGLIVPSARAIGDDEFNIALILENCPAKPPCWQIVTDGA